MGDSPLVGSGAYADNQTGGASATGDGESIMRVVMAKTATDAIARGTETLGLAGFHFSGTRFDCGSRHGFIEATIKYAIDHDDIRDDMLEHIEADCGDLIIFKRFKQSGLIDQAATRCIDQDG